MNEAPTDILMSSSQVQENSGKDTIVAYLTAIDVDRSPVGDNQQHTFSLLENSRSIFRIIGNQLQIVEDFYQCSKSQTCILNFEKNPVFDIKIKVTDDGEPAKSFEKSFLVHLVDVNDPPWNLTLSSNVVKENSPIGFQIGNFSALDEDFNQTLTFYLVDDAMGTFEIKSNHNLVLKKALNFEVQEVYKIKVKVADNGRPSLSVRNIP